MKMKSRSNQPLQRVTFLLQSLHIPHTVDLLLISEKTIIAIHRFDPILIFGLYVKHEKKKFKHSLSIVVIWKEGWKNRHILLLQSVHRGVGQKHTLANISNAE